MKTATTLGFLAAAWVGWVAGHGNVRLGVLTVAVLAALAVIFAGRPRLVLWVAATGVLVTQSRWPIVGSLSGVDLYLGDLLALVGAMAPAPSRVSPGVSSASSPPSRRSALC